MTPLKPAAGVKRIHPEVDADPDPTIPKKPKSHLSAKSDEQCCEQLASQSDGAATLSSQAEEARSAAGAASHSDVLEPASGAAATFEHSNYAQQQHKDVEQDRDSPVENHGPCGASMSSGLEETPSQATASEHAQPAQQSSINMSSVRQDETNEEGSEAVLPPSVSEPSLGSAAMHEKVELERPSNHMQLENEDFAKDRVSSSAISALGPPRGSATIPEITKSPQPPVIDVQLHSPSKGASSASEEADLPTNLNTSIDPASTPQGLNSAEQSLGTFQGNVPMEGDCKSSATESSSTASGILRGSEVAPGGGLAPSNGHVQEAEAASVTGQDDSAPNLHAGGEPGSDAPQTHQSEEDPERDAMKTRSRNLSEAAQKLLFKLRMVSTTMHTLLSVSSDTPCGISRHPDEELGRLYDFVLFPDGKTSRQHRALATEPYPEANSHNFLSALIGAFINDRIFNAAAPWPDITGVLPDQTFKSLSRMHDAVEDSVRSYIRQQIMLGDNMEQQYSINADNATADFLHLMKDHVAHMITHLSPEQRKKKSIWAHKIYDQFSELMYAAYNLKAQLDTDIFPHHIIWPARNSKRDDAITREIATFGRSANHQSPASVNKVLFPVFPGIIRDDDPERTWLKASVVLGKPLAAR